MPKGLMIWPRHARARLLRGDRQAAGGEGRPLSREGQRQQGRSGRQPGGGGEPSKTSGRAGRRKTSSRAGSRRGEGFGRAVSSRPRPLSRKDRGSRAGPAGSRGRWRAVQDLCLGARRPISFFFSFLFLLLVSFSSSCFFFSACFLFHCISSLSLHVSTACFSCSAVVCLSFLLFLNLKQLT